MNQHHYEPCDHPGYPCTAARCTCVQRGNFCEKFCICDSKCHHRFPGCNCKTDCGTKCKPNPIFSISNFILACPCFAAQRECDPDICFSCKSYMPMTEVRNGNCRNVSLQQGFKKHLLAAPSDVAGWGCFLKVLPHQNDPSKPLLGYCRKRRLDFRVLWRNHHPIRRRSTRKALR